VLPTPAQKDAGDALAAALQASAAQTGVHYLIWYGQIWSADRAGKGWRPYDGGGVYDPGDVTGGHYDHVHISVY
jgi:murein DD-endopeptidase